jgi:cytochrome P450
LSENHTATAPCPFAGSAAEDLVDPMLYTRGAAHDLWSGLRRDAPVTRHVLPDGRAFWSVTSYRDVTAVLRDATTFTSERGTLLSLLGQDDPAGGRELVATDPPRHTSLRTPVQRALAAKPVEGMREQFRAVVRDTLAPLADGGEIDLSARLRHLAVGVMGVLLDLPPEDWPRLTTLSLASVAPEDPLFGGRPGAAEAVLTASHRELFGYFHDLVRRRRARPGTDLVSLLLTTEWDGRPLNHGELVSNCYSLLLGGTVTTSQVPAVVLADFMGTDILDRWAADPALLGSGVEEALRWASPNTHFMRYAVRDTTLGGQRIPAGEAVVVWLASANRDAEAFPAPFDFDVRRRPNRHLAFGIGPHYCVGHSVVRVVLKLFFAELFSGFTDLVPAGPGVRLHSTTISGWSVLPIGATPRSPRGPVAY